MLGIGVVDIPELAQYGLLQVVSVLDLLSGGHFA